MIYPTQFESRLTLKDITAIYASNYDKMTLDYSKQMYEGICKDGHLIVSIKEVLQRSIPRILRRDLNAKINIDVRIDAEALRYDYGDIITGLRISKIIQPGRVSTQGAIECVSQYVTALVAINPDMIDQFKVGQKLPIRRGAAIYRPGSKKILINGLPYVPYVPETKFYQIEYGPTEKMFFEQTILPLIQKEKDRYDSLNDTCKKRWNWFKDNLSPTKKNSKVDGPTIESLETGIFGVDYTSDFSQMKLTKKTNENSELIKEDSKKAIIELCFPFIKWMSNLNDFAIEYEDDETFESNNHVWEFYKSLQK